MRETTKLFKAKREEMGLNLTQVAALIGIDTSLVNRIENEVRMPTREQLMKLADLYELDREELLVDWLSDKVLNELKGEKLAMLALKATELKLKNA